ncbi:MAG TPA: hypothetical protein VEZ26_07855, partial [Sphingomonadaceae bacterium]|nr:hypothetical protein [Sphingomonadaceae bacterium]
LQEFHDRGADAAAGAGDEDDGFAHAFSLPGDNAAGAGQSRGMDFIAVSVALPLATAGTIAKGMRRLCAVRGAAHPCR